MCTLRSIKWNYKVVVLLINYNIPLSKFISSPASSKSCKIHVLLIVSLSCSSPSFPPSLPCSSPCPHTSHFSETGAIWNSNQGSIKPRALDPWNWFGHWCFQTEKEGTEEPLPQRHWANVWGQIKCWSYIYSCAEGGLVFFFGSRVLSLALLNCLLECKVYRFKDIVTKNQNQKWLSPL